jgi:ABC-type taurine transport system substrate-binding protein
MTSITVLNGQEGFRESVAKVIRLSGVDPEEVPSLLRDVLRDDFDISVEAVFAQLF